MMTLGSLFDGSGGFPLAGAMHGIKPVWASEIEPYPIRVTKARFPNMEHLGSVLDVKGDQIAPVDIITFGSPCQDLSVAGKQKGIHEGERSSLFFEAVRIAKEMRAHDRAIGRTGVDVRPRFLVWENVPGAFSSHQGEDFRAVLEALGGIAQDGVSIPRPPKGKWDHAGCVVGDGWSIAWRLYDAQYWGVPQRRKRIYLVADLASERAGEILFERESLCGNPAEGGEARKGIAHDAPGGAGGGCGVKCLNPWDAQSIRQYDADGIYPTLNANATGGLNRQGVVAHNAPGGAGGSCEFCFPLNEQVILRHNKLGRATGFGAGLDGDPAYTLQANHPHMIAAGFVGRQGAKSGSVGYETNKAPTLRQGITSDVVYPTVARTLTAEHDASPCIDRGQNMLCYALKGNAIDRNTAQNGKPWSDGASYTLDATDRHGVCYAPNGNHCGNYEEADVSATLQTRYHYGSGGDAAAVVYDCRGNGDGEKVPTLTGDHGRRTSDYSAVAVYDTTQITSPLNYSNPRPGDPCHPLADQQHPPLCVGNTHRKYIVRRLTPIECCRLQGFPDWWEDGVEGSDSARYKMWGNGIALPCAADVLGRIARESQRNKEK